MKVYVKTPARLHLGLIDLNGDMGRMFGGLGIGINRPNVVLEAQKASKLKVTGQETVLVTQLAKRFLDAYSIKSGAHIHVAEAISSHAGFGSGTQMSLAVATALARLYKVDVSTQQLALTMGRVRRTGVGTAIFDKGGFVVDGGKLLKDGVCVPGKFPPLIFRQPFPTDWRFVVAVPNVNSGLSDKKEVQAFKELPKMPPELVGKMCRLIMLKLLPAIAETNIETFGEALTQVQATIGSFFTPVQGGTYSHTTVADSVEFLQKIGAHGAGQSSWGPAVYGVVQKQDAKTVLSKMKAFLQSGTGGEAFVAKANNKGATIKLIQH
ncbi:MAG: kinase [Candidatus Bathyarchaeota archaeon]|nr:kinase [Candidatus Bathyarchaeota archaeon]